MFDPDDINQVDEVITPDGPNIYIRMPDLSFTNSSGKIVSTTCMIIFPVETSLMSIATQAEGNNATRSAVVIPINQWEILRDAVDERIGFLRDYAAKYEEKRKLNDQ